MAAALHFAGGTKFCRDAGCESGVSALVLAILIARALNAAAAEHFAH